MQMYRIDIYQPGLHLRAVLPFTHAVQAALWGSRMCPKARAISAFCADPALPVPTPIAQAAIRQNIARIGRTS